MVIERAGKLPPEVTRRGAIVALEFAEEWATSGGVTLEFRDAPLREVVEAISEVTGDRFIYDSLEGAVTVSAGGRITRAEAMELLHAALLMRGYAALQSPGGAYKILPIQAGSTSGPWQAADELSGAAPVTTLIQLRSVSPQRVVDALRGWLGQQLIALPFPRTNSVILSGSADRIRRILTVIHALDESSDTEFAIVRLRYRDAADAAALIENVQKEGERNVPEVFVDERSNALLVRATPQRLAEVRSFLRTIDRPLEGGGGIHVLRLHAADPEQIANVLNSLSQGSASEGALAESASALLNEEFQITVDAPTRSLLVRSSEETFRALAEVIAELDRIPPRIRLEVLVLELTSSGALSLGFDAFFPISNPKDQNDTIAAVLLNPSGGGLIQPGTPGGPRGAVRFTRAPLIVPIVNSDGVPVSIQVPRESFVVTADAEELQGRVLMRPNLLMVAGEEHELFAGANVPIPVERDEAEEALGQLQTTQDIERQDVGLRLRVTPTTGQRGSVRLDLQIEKTAVIDSLVGGNQSLGPSLQQRVIETTVTLQGEEYAIVALSEDERQLDTETGVPFLRDIPFLGFFFRATTKTRIEDQFVVAVRARALRGDLDLLADSARERIGFERNMERVEGLPLSMAAPFAVLAGTYTSEAEAARNASQIAGPEGQGQVVTWRWQEEERFDVVLSPYESIVEAAGAVNTLLDAGYSARIIAMPEAPARAAR
jgi:general secretion pathway protein D